MGRTDFEDEIRAHGPATVRGGPEDAAVVLVLDPAGEAPHAGLPATWRPLAEQVNVVWSRHPAARRTGKTAEELLAPLASTHRQVHLVGCARTALTAVAVAVEHRDVVASVVLVDPPWAAQDTDPDAARVARAASALNVPVRQVHTSRHACDQRADPPMPIGHPEVVRVVAALLAETALPG
jgi:pimeloyl-ACP methyl ester carboxylesterase